MGYELRQPGKPAQSFESESDAMEAARALLAADPDSELEVIDLSTGKPCAPAASAAWREELKGKVGF